MKHNYYSALNKHRRLTRNKMRQLMCLLQPIEYKRSQEHSYYFTHNNIRYRVSNHHSGNKQLRAMNIIVDNNTDIESLARLIKLLNYTYKPIYHERRDTKE